MKFKLNEDINTEYDLDSDIELVTELNHCSEEDLKDFIDIDNIEDVYEYAWGNGIRLNNIKWQEYKDLDNNDLIFLCHGSRSGIKGNIRLDVSGDSNDFGDGFYCGTRLDQAGMFVADEPNSSMYVIAFNPEGLTPATFNVDTEWMLAVAYFRETVDDYKDSDKIKAIKEKVDNADYVIAPIADNRIFELIDSFTEGEITDQQCLYAMSATHLGRQYVFKKPSTLSHIEIVDHLYLCDSEKDSYAMQGTIESNTSLNKAIISRKKFQDKGLYIDELLKN